MTPKGLSAIGMTGGLLWAALVLGIGSRIDTIPLAMIQPALMGAFFAPGLVLMAMIFRLMLRRHYSEGMKDGSALVGPAEIDGRVLTNTLEQIVLALCIWPLAGFYLGVGTALALGLGFAIARIVFWVGYHIAPPLRALGFGATFFPTVGAAFLVLWRLIT